MNPHEPISLVLTTYNRFDMVIECVATAMNDDRIQEIVISDDKSTDGSYEKLVEYFKDTPKVKIYQNPTNLDCYTNKAVAVAKSTSNWCILFDSDNVLPQSYLNSIYARPLWDAEVVYCPDFAEPHFNYTAFSGHYIDKETVAHWMRQKHFSTVLNTCNYFVNRQSYLAVWDCYADPHTSDSIYQMLNWFRSGRKMLVVPGLRYYHRVHDGSHYKQNHHKTGTFANMVETELKNLR